MLKRFLSYESWSSDQTWDQLGHTAVSMKQATRIIIWTELLKDSNFFYAQEYFRPSWFNIQYEKDYSVRGTSTVEEKRRQGSDRTSPQMSTVLGLLLLCRNSKLDSFCPQTTVRKVSDDNKIGGRNNLWLKSNSEFFKKDLNLA